MPFAAVTDKNVIPQGHWKFSYRAAGSAIASSFLGNRLAICSWAGRPSSGTHPEKPSHAGAKPYA